jgi:drug/metabolite transporter (DMT)-like permease
MAGIPWFGEIMSLSAALFWAIAVILFKRSGETMPAASLNLFKNLLAVALLTPTVPLFGETLLPPDQPLEAWLLLAASGFLGIAVADTMFLFSLQKLGAGLTAVVDTAYMPLMLGLSFVWLGEEIGLNVLLGACLIMAAVLVGSAARPPPGRTRRDIAVGTLIGLGGVALMAVGIVMVKGVLNQAPVLWATWLRMVAGAAGLLPILALRRHRVEVLAALRPGPHYRFAVPATISGTYLAMITWVAGMKHIEVSRAALLNQLSTAFIFALAILFLKEPLTWRRLLAIGLAVPGAILVVI